MQHFPDIDLPILIPLTALRMNVSRSHTEKGPLQRNPTLKVPGQVATFRGSLVASHTEERVEHCISRRDFASGVVTYLREGWTEASVWKSAVRGHVSIYPIFGKSGVKK